MKSRFDGLVREIAIIEMTMAVPQKMRTTHFDCGRFETQYLHCRYGRP